MDAWTPPPLLSPLARLPLRSYLGQRRARLNARDAAHELAQDRSEREGVELFLRPPSMAAALGPNLEFRLTGWCVPFGQP